MSAFIHFWLDCFWRGATFGDGVFSATEIICAILWCFYKTKKDDEHAREGREKKVKDFGKWCFIGVLIFSTFFVAPFLKFQEANNRKTTQEYLDYIEQNRPYLEPHLVIDLVNSNTVVDYHYEIQNNGKLPASSITEEQKSQFFIVPDFGTHNTYLAPGAKMSLTSDGVPVTGSFSVDLYLKYVAEYQGTNKTYNSVSRFFARKAVTGKEYNYEVALPDLTEDPIRGTNTLATFFDNGLKLPSGTILSWIEYNSTNQSFVRSQNRFLFLDEISRTAIFEFTPETGKPIVLVNEILTNKNGTYMVLASWTNNFMMLCINTNCVTNSFNNEINQ